MSSSFIIVLFFAFPSSLSFPDFAARIGILTTNGSSRAWPTFSQLGRGRSYVMAHYISYFHRSQWFGNHNMVHNKHKALWCFSLGSFELMTLTHIMGLAHATGWSFATAIFYIFLTGTKKQQNHITQSFLSTSYIDILRSHYGQVQKSLAFPGSAKIVLWLYTAKAENPEHIWALLISKSSTQIPSDTPWHPLTPPDVPQTPPRHLHESKDTNKCQLTLLDMLKQHSIDRIECWMCHICHVTCVTCVT